MLNGRLNVNIISSPLAGLPPEPSAVRYKRTREFMHLLKAFWTEEHVRFKGEFYDFDLKVDLPRPVHPAGPPLYFGGASPEAKIAAAAEADVYLFWGDTVPFIREGIAEMQALAAQHDRSLLFGLRVHIIARETEAEALEAAERLVAAHLAGDSRAFPELVARYRRPLLGFLARMIGDRERAEDLVQEAFIRVHRHLHRFDPSRKFSTWVYTIASNLAKNELRNRSRSPLVLHQTLREGREYEDPQPLHCEDSSTRPDELFARRQVAELLRAAVARVAEHHRQVFVLRDLEGRTYEEIATLTGINLGTVKSS
jgi:RNA polymerase sigma factor (sigma-70 family)